jgi:hypothetical protein
MPPISGEPSYAECGRRRLGRNLAQFLAQVLGQCVAIIARDVHEDPLWRFALPNVEEELDSASAQRRGDRHDANEWVFCEGCCAYRDDLINREHRRQAVSLVDTSVRNGMPPRYQWVATRM